MGNKTLEAINKLIQVDENNHVTDFSNFPELDKSYSYVFQLGIMESFGDYYEMGRLSIEKDWEEKGYNTIINSNAIPFPLSKKYIFPKSNTNIIPMLIYSMDK